MMMENRVGLVRVDGDGPNHNGRSDRRRRRARDGRRDGACNTTVDIVAARQWLPTAVRRRRGAEHMQVHRDADVAWRVHHGGGAATRRLQHSLCVTGDGSWQAAAATTAPTDHNAGC